ncbi:MAG: HlyD family secretion protein, partial [Vicinamibacteria bacterium]
AFAVEEAKVAHEKARIEADVPKELLPLRTFQERQLELERARTRHEEARDVLETLLRTKEEKIALKKLALEKTLYDIRVAEEAIEALTLLAPRDGFLVVAEIPWEGRKVQEGDNVWAGFLLLKIPDLTEMRVMAELSDVDDGRIEPGMKAVVTLDAHPELQFEGEVASIPPVAQETSPRSLRRAFTVRVVLSETDPELMRPGMAARVEVITRTMNDVLLAPRSTIDFEGRALPPRACNLFDCVLEAESP